MSGRAQSTIEFTFAMIIVLLLVFGLIRIFRWAGMDLAERRWAYDKAMANDPNFVKESMTLDNLSNVGVGTAGTGTAQAQEMIPDAYRPKRINAFFRN